jgi:hypothetical protein
MFIRVVFGLMLSLLVAWPLAAEETGDGPLTGVTIAEDGTMWTVELQVKGGKIEGDLSYDHCQICPESDGEYYCAAQDLSPKKTFSAFCISRTKTIRGDTHVGSEFVRVEGNLTHAQVDPGFYPRVEFTLLNARQFKAYRRFAAGNKKAGTDKFAAKGLPEERTAARPGREGQVERLAEEREKAEATLRELRRQRESLARERVAAEQARRRMREERAALERERRQIWAPGFRRGLTAFEEGDYAKALSEWRPLADQGHAEAQYRLGKMHEKGWGTAKDSDAALRWYRLAAKQGHEQAKKILKVLEIGTKSATPISF